MQNRAISLGLVAMLASALPAAAQISQGEGDLRVMSYNIDEGTDYLEVTATTNSSQFLAAVGQTITQVRATDPPQRMQAVADQIIAAAPTLVSLQEVDQWFTGSFDPVSHTCGPVALEFDMLQELTNALVAKGAAYEVAVQARQFAFPPVPGFIPPGTFQCVQVINHNVILARSDLDPTRFKWSNPQSGLFADCSI